MGFDKQFEYLQLKQEAEEATKKATALVDQLHGVGSIVFGPTQPRQDMMFNTAASKESSALNTQAAVLADPPSVVVLAEMHFIVTSLCDSFHALGDVHRSLIGYVEESPGVEMATTIREALRNLRRLTDGIQHRVSRLAEGI